MNNFIRTSGVDQINNIRRNLWESIYSNFSNMNSLTNHISNNFIDIDTVDFDFNEMSISIKSKDCPFEYDKAKSAITNAYKGFINDMFIKGSLNDSNYNKCINMIDNLFFITFNDHHNIKIHL